MAVRLLVFDNTEAFIGEVSDIRSLTRIEEINGEHSLTFSTPMELAKQNRVLYRDSQDAWHEYVITGVEQTHDEDVQAVGTYYCVWSLQHDLEGTIVKTQPGKVNPVTSTVALTHALAGTARWTVGSVTQNTTGGASMYYLSGWDALGKVVEVWGGEVSVTISVDEDGTIASREVNLLDHLGSAASVRRFDYSADMQSIKRTVEDAPFTCRITPRGAAVESENGGYGRKIDITSVNGGVEYLEDAGVVDIVKLPDGNGGWEYPNQVVEFDGIEDPQTLYDTAMAHLHDFTRPRVSYEAEVVQLAAAGMNPHGIALGDAVDVVDKTFTPAGLRLSGRVTRAEWDDLDPANNAITIGFNPQGFAGQFQDLQADIRAINDWRDTLTTEEYIEGIIDRLNETVNATGGYTYMVEGIGLVTYDVAVTDPAVGSEASAVVEIRGGTIRIANSRDGQGDWEWKTVFTAGHIAGELVTAAEIVTGYIGSAGGTFIDLDNNIIQLGESTSTHVTVDSDSMDILDNTTVIAHFGYGEGADSGGSPVDAPYFTLGKRYVADSGAYSSSATYDIGSRVTYNGDSYICKVAVTTPEAWDSSKWALLVGNYSLVAGNGGAAAGEGSLALGQGIAIGRNSVALGLGTTATAVGSVAVGCYNVEDTASDKLFIVGKGFDNVNRSDAFTVDLYGNAVAAGSITASNLTPVEIKRADLTFTRCSQNGTSPCGWRIGNLVIVYIRLSVTGSAPTVSGFPAYTAANSTVSVSVYRQSDNAALGGYMTNAGVLTLPTGANGNNLMCSCVYVAS